MSTLLPGKKAVLAYVKERLKNGKLVSTRLVSRRSADDGASWNQPKPVTKEARLLRMAPNLVNEQEPRDHRSSSPANSTASHATSSASRLR